MRIDPEHTDYLVQIFLDIPMRSFSETIENERRISISDLLEKNFFKLVTMSRGPYDLALSVSEQKLIFDVRNLAGISCFGVGLSLTSFRKLIKDYWIVCESYYKARAQTPLHQLETLDMARRGLHNEAAEVLQQKLRGKIEIDFDTARRLFTLICVLKM